MILVKPTPDGSMPAVAHVMRVCDLIEAMPEMTDVPGPVPVVLSSTEYGLLVTELRTRGGAGAVGWVDPPYIVVGKVHVLNGGTDDEDTINEANRLGAERVGFAWKRDNLRIR